MIYLNEIKEILGAEERFKLHFGKTKAKFNGLQSEYSEIPCMNADGDYIIPIWSPYAKSTGNKINYAGPITVAITEFLTSYDNITDATQNLVQSIMHDCKAKDAKELLEMIMLSEIGVVNLFTTIPRQKATVNVDLVKTTASVLALSYIVNPRIWGTIVLEFLSLFPYLVRIGILYDMEEEFTLDKITVDGKEYTNNVILGYHTLVNMSIAINGINTHVGNSLWDVRRVIGDDFLGKYYMGEIGIEDVFSTLRPNTLGIKGYETLTLDDDQAKLELALLNKEIPISDDDYQALDVGMRYCTKKDLRDLICRSIIFYERKDMAYNFMLESIKQVLDDIVVVEIEKAVTKKEQQLETKHKKEISKYVDEIKTKQSEIAEIQKELEDIRHKYKKQNAELKSIYRSTEEVDLIEEDEAESEIPFDIKIDTINMARILVVGDDLEFITRIKGYGIDVLTLQTVNVSSSNQFPQADFVFIYTEKVSHKAANKAKSVYQKVYYFGKRSATLFIDYAYKIINDYLEE